MGRKMDADSSGFRLTEWAVEWYNTDKAKKGKARILRYQRGCGRAVIAVLDLKSICPLTTFDRKFTGIARFPAVTRDLSMVVPQEIQAGTIEKMILQRGGKLLENVVLFDVYEGEQIEKCYKSMAYKFVLRSPEKSLDEKDINSVMNKIMNGLESMNIQLRQ